MTQGADNPQGVDNLQGVEVTVEEKVKRGRELEEKLIKFKDDIDNRFLNCDVYVHPDYPYIDPTSPVDEIEEQGGEEDEDGEENEGDEVHKFTIRLSRSPLDTHIAPTNFETPAKEIQTIINPYKDIMIEGSYQIKNVPVRDRFVHVVIFSI